MAINKFSEKIVENGVEMMLSETYRDFNKDGPWNKIGDPKAEKELTTEERIQLLTNSRDRYWKTPEGRCLVESAVHYIIGSGIVYHSEDENPIVQESLDQFWNNPSNNMELRQKEIVRRALRDGEVFIRFFESSSGTCQIRFVEPEQIVDIKRDPEDNETIESYERQWTALGATTVSNESIPSADVIHIKLNVDMNMKRGRSYMEPVIKRLVQLDDFIEGRTRKNRIAAGHILEKIVKGKMAGADKVQSVSDGMSDAKIDAGVSTASKKMPKLGSVIVHNESIEYKWCNPEIRADDCKEDARLIKLSICSGLNAPEFLLADASNANYSSTLVSENPYVKSIEDLQDTFAIYFQAIFRKVIERLLVKKVIPATSTETKLYESWVIKLIPKKLKAIREAIDQALQTETKTVVLTKTSTSIEFPQMIHKELKTDTEAYQIHSTMGWASDETIAGKLGYDFVKEQEKIARSKQAQAEDPNYDAERQAELDAKNQEPE